jgi:glycosyltransferase involved in cell wall biosynthesis
MEMTRYFDIVYLPSVRATWMLLPEDQRKELMTSLDKLVETGVFIPDYFYKLSDNPPESLWQNPIKRLDWQPWMDLAKGYSKQIRADFLYIQDTPHGPPYLAESMKVGYGIMYQGVPFRTGIFGGELKKIFHIPNAIQLWKAFTGEILRNERDKAMFLRHLKSRHLKMVTSLTDVPLEMTKKFRSDLILHKIVPGNAIEKPVSGLTAGKKGGYVLFYARLSINKGILEIPYIWSKILKAREDLNLFLIGKFQDSITELQFRRKCKKYNIEHKVKILGFIEEKSEIFRILANALIVIYPTHEDGLPFTLIEAIAHNTHVVAYNLPTIYDNFSGSYYIHLVREYDKECMAATALDVINKVENKIKTWENNGQFHPEYSWTNVAKAEADAINSVFL